MSLALISVFERAFLVHAVQAVDFIVNLLLLMLLEPVSLLLQRLLQAELFIVRDEPLLDVSLLLL